MTEENTLVAKPTQVIPADSKWIDGISSIVIVGRVGSLQESRF